MEKRYRCPFEALTDVIGGKWKMHILWRLNIHDFLELAEIEEASFCPSRELLAEQLRELERDGFIQRISYPEIPPRVEYHITSVGRSLWPVLSAMQEWSIGYMQGLGMEVEEEVLEELKTVKRDHRIQELGEGFVEEKLPLDDYFKNTFENSEE
jgi:DNA-binding HxlR family transcriptional regulator